MTAVLLDSSVMVALFDDRDRHHRACVDRMRRLPAGTELVTTWPCVTESSYLLAPRNHLALLGWLHQGGARLVNAEAHELGDWMGWMQRYSELGKALMDLADASLVWLAIKEATTQILTQDHRDFLRYRLPDGQAFEVIA
jgi:predicted nucleic acid-binding protein